jgi:hypothetical protein
MFDIPSLDDVESCVITEDVILHGKPPVYGRNKTSRQRTTA